MMDMPRHTDFDFKVVGFVVSRCIVDFGYTLDMSSGRRNATLRIDVPFEVYIEGRVLRCDAATHREALGPALLLFRRSVEVMWIADDDTLHITFSDEASLSVPRDPDFESWTFNGPDGTLVVAGPGSRLSVFGPPSGRGSTP